MPAKLLSGCYHSLLLSSLLFLFSPDLLHAQKKSLTSHPGVNWILDATVNGVQFYHAFSTCAGKKIIFLKLKNSNRYKVEVSWQEVFATQYEPELESYRGEKKIVLQSGELAETNCGNQNERKLLVLPDQVNPTYVAEVSKFNFKGIRVSRVN